MLDKVIPVILRAVATVAKAPVQRSKIYIETLKKFGFEPDHPPSDFSAVYAYTLIEYALAEDEPKAQELLELFAESEIKAAFRQAFEEWNVRPLDETLDRRLNWEVFGNAWNEYDNEWNFIGNVIREKNIDIQREVTVLFAVFLDVVKRSRTPKERLQEFRIEQVWQEIQELRQELAQPEKTDLLAEKIAAQLAAKLQPALMGADEKPRCQASELAQQLDAWFQSLNYGRESYERIEEDYCEWGITIPARRGYDRILVRCISGEAGIAQIQDLQRVFEEQRLDEGWLVSNRRISSGVKELLQDRAYRGLYCYTLDEVIDQVADFEKYLVWLEDEIKKGGLIRITFLWGVPRMRLILQQNKKSVLVAMAKTRAGLRAMLING